MVFVRCERFFVPVCLWTKLRSERLALITQSSQSAEYVKGLSHNADVWHPTREEITHLRISASKPSDV